MTFLLLGVLALIACASSFVAGYNLAVAHTEERWSDAVARADDARKRAAEHRTKLTNPYGAP